MDNATKSITESVVNNIELYTYCKSSAAYRVRIALNLKNIDYQSHYVSLINDGGENFKAAYLRVNPQAMVPSLKVNGAVLTQSNAIIEWLEETFANPAFLPENTMLRARARSLAQIIACDIHPLNNLRVLDYLKTHYQSVGEATNEEAKLSWYRYWIQEGFHSIETILTGTDYSGEFCVGDTPSIADIYLIPQVYNARRFNCDMNNYPRILQIANHCASLEAFSQASPEQQEDY